MSRRRRKPCTGDLANLSLDEAMDRAVAAKPFKDETGITGRLKFGFTRPGSTMRCLEFVPNATGKRTEAYRRIKRMLGDDWVSDLCQTDSIVTVDYIARALRCDP
jgi:hypothetical protein